MNNKTQLLDDEIIDLLRRFLVFNKLDSYKEECPEFKSGNCEGNTSGNGGCSICEYFNIHDSTNAKPPIGTKRWEELIKDYNEVANKMAKDCKLKFNSFYCKYKGAFNFCSKCDCVYKEKLKEIQR